LVRQLLFVGATMKPWIATALLLFACTAEQSSVSTALTQPVGACGDVETHVIGSFDPGGQSSVVIERPGKHVLVLSAHEATTWKVTASPAAKIVHIYAVGYHPQTVIAPPGVDVITDSMDQTGIYANGYMWPSTATENLLRLAGKRVHHDATSFHGCKTATRWTIAENMRVSSDCPDQGGIVQYDTVSCGGSDSGGSCGVGSGSGSGSGSNNNPV
jgi:hypothetical protein